MQLKTVMEETVRIGVEWSKLILKAKGKI